MLVLDAAAGLLQLDAPARLGGSGEVGGDGAVELRDAGQPGRAAQSAPAHAGTLLPALVVIVVVVVVVLLFLLLVAGEAVSGADGGEAHGGRDAGEGGAVAALGVAVAVDAVEGGRGDGGDVAAFEDAGGATHAVALGDSAGAGRRSGSRLGAAGGHGEREYVGTATHVGFAEGPMHGFTCAPGHAEFGCDGVPEIGLESARKISCLVCTVAGTASLVLPLVEFGEERRIIPIVDSRQLVALLLVPVGSLFEVVLVVQSAADAAAAWYLNADVVPFHATATEYDDFCIFGWRPFASVLSGGV